MADRENEIGAVHRIEMQAPHAVIDEIKHLLGADRGRYEATRDKVVVKAFEALGEPAWNARPGPLRKARRRLDRRCCRKRIA